MSVEHLSPEDATVWCVQARDAPLQLGGVALCDGAALRGDSDAVPIEAIRRHFEARLATVPRFRKVLRPVGFGQGLVWVDDEHFDIARHLRSAALPAPGSDDQLREFVARVLETPLPADRPLWEFWVVEGVAGDRVALVPRVSHVLGDGVAVLRMMLSLFDTAPQSDDEPPSDWLAAAHPGAVSMLAGAVLGRWRRGAGTARSLGRLLADPVRTLAGVPGLVVAGASILKPAPPLAFTRPVGPRRDFAWLRLPLPPLEEVKHAEQVKLNDVVLAVVAAGVSAYVEASGTSVDRLRGVVPVSTHGAGVVGKIENRFSMMFVDLPGSPDPLERLRLVRAETARRKDSLQTTLGTTALTLGGLLPQRLLRAVGPRLLHHQPFANLVVTNVPGPRLPLYLFGSRLLEMYPFVTVTANLGVNVAVVSYTDALGVGITVDVDTVPDVGALAAAIERAADDLVQASGRRRRRPENGTAPA
jgi:WS/DGAT/MGAT family acyltransferase